MNRLAWILLMAPLGAVLGCSDSQGAGAPSGQTLYLAPHADGNSFACATCHALEEPASDRMRRPGHSIGDAANRPSYKNGQLSELLDAVNSCRVEWMTAPAFDDEDPRWLALLEYLTEVAGSAPASALSYQIVNPPTELGGGDAGEGQDLFNESCVVCHGVDAAGTERGPVLRGSLLDEETIARRVRTSGTVDSEVYEGLTGGRMPFWAADRLSDEELLDVVAFVLANEGGAGGAGGQGGSGGTNGLRDCESTHSKIGQVAELQTFAHQVSGTAVIVDDCTIRVDDFVYDGTGVDVRFYSGLGGNYIGGFSMSEMDLRRAGGYDGSESVYAQLPDGRTLDELDGISVWCVPVAASFGDGLFASP
ncbi:MAG: DM13 domain-containing protein [Polyangiales bacterium]